MPLDDMYDKLAHGKNESVVASMTLKHSSNPKLIWLSISYFNACTGYMTC